MKLEHITTTQGDVIEITANGHSVSLNPPDAMMLLAWLDERKGELFRLVHDLDREPLLQECKYCGQYHESHLIEQCPLKPKTFMQQTQPDENTRFRASWVDDLDI